MPIARRQSDGRWLLERILYQSSVIMTHSNRFAISGITEASTLAKAKRSMRS